MILLSPELALELGPELGPEWREHIAETEVQMPEHGWTEFYHRKRAARPNPEKVL